MISCDEMLKIYGQFFSQVTVPKCDVDEHRLKFNPRIVCVPKFVAEL